MSLTTITFMDHITCPVKSLKSLVLASPERSSKAQNI